jgi:hypothetical protein
MYNYSLNLISWIFWFLELIKISLNKSKTKNNLKPTNLENSIKFIIEGSTFFMAPPSTQTIIYIA